MRGEVGSDEDVSGVASNHRSPHSKRTSGGSLVSRTREEGGDQIATGKAGTAESRMAEETPSFTNYVGQAHAKKKLLTAATSARMRGVPMKHHLIDGHPGIGKTTLAILIAEFLGTSWRFASGKIKQAEGRRLLATMQDRDVLIIDEIHQTIGSRESEWLLHYLEQGCLVGPRGIEEVPKVTILGCTTEVGKGLGAILDRFTKVTLKAPTRDDATKIAAVMSGRIFEDLPTPTKANFEAIADAAANNPRTIRDLLETTRDVALIGGNANWRKRGGYDLSETLDLHQLTPDGLDVLAQRYVLCMANDFAGESVGEGALKDRLQEPSGLRATERLLMDLGYIGKTKQGRVLMQRGLARAMRLEAEGMVA